MKYHMLLFLFTLTQVSLMAQTRITGQVMDTNGEGLTGANIYLEGTYDGSTSDLEGKFVLESTETGEQVLHIDFIGFKGFQKTIILEGRTIVLSQITLKEELNELTAVTITAGTFEAGDKKKQEYFNMWCFHNWFFIGFSLSILSPQVTPAGKVENSTDKRSLNHFYHQPP